MTRGKARNMAASVRHRLLALAKIRREDFQLVLTRYCVERFLYRLGESKHASDFVLKGAMLFQVWSDVVHRPTRDLDLLARGKPSVARFVQVFRNVCRQKAPDDGLEFLHESVNGEAIQQDAIYSGLRMRCDARLENARIRLQVDVGFGDAVIPRPRSTTYPAMLEFPAPVLKAYSQESVIAEKFQAMVALGIANSRMKDFFDVWCLAQNFEFDGSTLTKAVAGTFRRRKTAIPGEAPVALTAVFTADPTKARQWQAFLKRSGIVGRQATLPDVCGTLHDFLMPVAQAVSANDAFPRQWPPGGTWRE